MFIEEKTIFVYVKIYFTLKFTKMLKSKQKDINPRWATFFSWPGLPSNSLKTAV